MTNINVPANLVKELRSKTGIGFMECKKALIESNLNIEKAVEYLRISGNKIENKIEKGNEGGIGFYIHNNNKLVALVEVNCKTDFAANTEEFKQLCHNLVMHVTALKPKYVSREEIPIDISQAELNIAKKQAEKEGKPEKIANKIAEGKLEKYYKENCLLEQKYVIDNKYTVQDVINECVAKIKEPVVVKKFVIYEVGKEN